MEQKVFKNKYPLYTLDIAKSDCQYQNVPEILEAIKSQIEAHKVATFIAKFDHFSHTKSLKNGDINADILDAQNIMFCFGIHLPDADSVGIRPRAIGVTEFAEFYTLNFMEAPNPVANEAMESWVKSLIK